MWFSEEVLLLLDLAFSVSVSAHKWSVWETGIDENQDGWDIKIELGMITVGWFINGDVGSSKI